MENPGPDPLTVGLLFTWADPPGGPDAGPAPGRPHEVVEDRPTAPWRDAPTTPDRTRPPRLRGTLAIAALEADGWTLTARAAFDPVADTRAVGDFAPTAAGRRPRRAPAEPPPSRTVRTGPPSPRPRT